jgi:hypothetical protein
MPLLARAEAQKAPGQAPGGVLAVQSGGADVETWLGKTAAEVGQMLVGCSISKLFPKYGYFKGEVEFFDAQNGMFAVVYDDDEEEMMPLEQLARCLPKAQEKLAREYLGHGRLGPGIPSRASQNLRLSAIPTHEYVLTHTYVGVYLCVQQ